MGMSYFRARLENYVFRRVPWKGDAAAFPRNPDPPWLESFETIAQRLTPRHFCAAAVLNE